MSERSSHPPHRLGDRGEAIAGARLISAGWTLLARNYRLGRREIDLVAARHGLLAFIEVKTRSGSGFGGPEAAVNWRKRREIEAVAGHFVRLHRLGDVQLRFDAVGVRAGPYGHPPEVDHVEDAWRPGWR